MGPSPVVRVDDALRGVAKLGFDTSPFLYLVEQHTAYILVVREIFSRLDAGAFVVVSSVITLVEVLTQPKKAGAVLINSQYLSIDVVTHAIAERAADLRARYNLRTPDALQLATALVAGCDAFLTNDLALRRVADLRVLALSTLAL